MVCKVFSFISNLVVAIFIVLLLVTLCECCGEYKKWSRKQKINHQIMQNSKEDILPKSEEKEAEEQQVSTEELDSASNIVRL